MDDESLNRVRNVLSDESVVTAISPPPKYLSPFVDVEKVLFVYKPKKQDSYQRINSQSSSSSDSDTEDLTGQPLECPFSSDDDDIGPTNTFKREEDCHYPLCLSDARKIISFVNLEVDRCDIPVFVLTDGEDVQRTIILGASKINGWRFRSWITAVDISASNQAVINVDHMMQWHNRLALINPRHMRSEVHCKFIMREIEDNHATFLQESNGHLEFDVAWKTPSFSIPLNEAVVKMTINTTVGDETSVMADLWSQLTLLYDYLEIIKKWKSERVVQGLYSRHSVDFPNRTGFSLDETPKSVQDRLTQLLREPNKTTKSTSLSQSTGKHRSLEEVVVNITERKGLEFTDMLWSLLIECKSYEEICCSLDTIFRQVKDGACRPYIKSSNITRLAQAIRCCKNDPTHFEMILEPLELLVEIGIEKLRKEYVSMYLLAKVSTFENLRVPAVPKFPEINASDWLEQCSMWILWLQRLHVALQLMVFTERTVTCKNIVVPLTTLTLEHYFGAESTIRELISPKLITSQTFTTVVNTKDVNELLNKKLTSFNSWTLKLYSETDHRKVTSIFHRNMDELFPSWVGFMDDNDLEATNGTFIANGSSPYYSYNYCSVGDRFN